MEEIGNNESVLRRKKSMKTIKIIIVLLIILFLIAIGLVCAINYLRSKEFKFYIDGNKKSETSSLFVIENNVVFVSIKDFADYIGYSAYNGGYKQYSEDSTKCYLQNNNEVVNYELNSDSIYKTILSEKSEDATGNTTTTSNSNTNANSTLNIVNSNYEYFTIDEPVKMINDKLYTTIEGISKGCNVNISYDAEKNTVTVYTLSYLAKLYTNRIKEADIASSTTLFSNRKAALYNLVIVKNTSGNYGVVDTSGNEIIGTKYGNIKFVESSEEFIVETIDGKIGIISNDGTTKIKPEYDELKQIDSDNNLYLVKADSNYGVISKNGKIIVSIDYEQIGIDKTQFVNDDITNEYILYDNCIPVKKDGLWGFISITGQTIVVPTYTNLGCVVATSSTSVAKNVLLIPSYEAIVICKDKSYGLINSLGEELIPTAVTDFYMKTTTGSKIYYLTYNKETRDVLDYLQNTLNLTPVTKDTTTNSNETINNTENSDNQAETKNEEIQLIDID